ncbi:MAG TPA: AbrB/MazE/SpoVT family DNA-binding domain-containing protein [Candidatus Hydrogenedentes bacterium]|nr:AbrB/MazE/SpoVT family DNA-binding domain-containing protein [Candidatus Hydrogenedentota bacterium]HNT86957.1 AbrB/MazE/SpoVT family DNA-binding domain-containing protein [Candidatus Hydrogenedentota bacterium]
MRTRVRKRGNSLAVRIPKSFAEETGLTEASTVEVSLVEDKIVVATVPGPEYSLEELTAGITRRNRHPEFETGGAVGNEAW